MNQQLTVAHDSLRGSIAEMLIEIEGLLRTAGEKADCYKARIDVPRGLGTGHWDFYKVSPHLYVLIVDVEYHDDIEIIVPSDIMAKVRVLLAGSLRSTDGQINLDGTGAFVESYPGTGGSSYIIEGGRRCRLAILNCDRTFFECELGLPAEMLPFPISYLFDTKAIDPRGGVVTLGPDVLRAANEIMRAETRFSPPVIYPYLAAKGREIACAMIAELNAQRSRPQPPVRSSVRDVSRINEARDILLDQFQRPPTIPQLARSIGMNQTKLKVLFKSTFGLTVHDFTQRCRMDRAVELLTTTDIGIAEIAYAVGYEHPASFTHAFRSFFGHAPSQVRRANWQAGSGGNAKAS